jgi:low affinity Fe/Cu permease
MHKAFSDFARAVARVMGSPLAFILALLMVVAWAVSGPYFGYSNTWQLFINTGTTVVTFLMVVLLQHSQNHDAKAVHLKLDELIRSAKYARNSLVDLESMTDEELEMLHDEFQRIRERSQKRSKNGHPSASS